MNEYQPQVITAPAEPGTVRRVGCLEIPADRAERSRPEPAPMIEGEVLGLARREDGRLLCYRKGWPARGTGCAGCRFSGHEVGCPAAFKDAYGRTAPKRGPKPRVRLRRSEMTPEQLERQRAYDLRRKKARYRDRRISDCTPEEAEKLRARWRAKKARKRRLAMSPAQTDDTSHDC